MSGRDRPSVEEGLAPASAIKVAATGALELCSDKATSLEDDLEEAPSADPPIDEG